MRGGGVGFYIRNGLTVEIIENLSPFENKIIEALTIKLTYPDSKVTYLTSIYRSNGTLANVTPAQQLDRFMEKFATLLTDLQALNKVSFVFLDANINLLRLQLPDPSLYFNCILVKGFLQIISKATRIQNESNTLIDHILTNSKGLDICSGTLISDVSDHFFTFVLPRTGQSNKLNHRTVLTRDFSNQNMLEFRTALGDTDWTS
jgi:exonuclease III